MEKRRPRMRAPMTMMMTTMTTTMAETAMAAAAAAAMTETTRAQDENDKSDNRQKKNISNTMFEFVDWPPNTEFIDCVRVCVSASEIEKERERE